MAFEEINDVTLTNVSITCLPLGEADKGINFNNATHIRGAVTLTGLLQPQGGGDPFLLYFNDGAALSHKSRQGFTV